jgi:hypothetical protein
MALSLTLIEFRGWLRSRCKPRNPTVSSKEKCIEEYESQVAEFKKKLQHAAKENEMDV